MLLFFRKMSTLKLLGLVDLLLKKVASQTIILHAALEMSDMSESIEMMSEQGASSNSEEGSIEIKWKDLNFEDLAK
jgi:hypothetical protein